MFKELKDFLPDHPRYRNEGLTDAKNVIPSFKSYKPMKDISPVSTNALTNRCQGFASFKSSAGNITSFAGDVSKLYKYLANTFSDISGGTTFSCAADTSWQFTQFSNFIIGSNGSNSPQVWELDNSSSWSDLGGSPPNFKFSAVVRSFLVTGWQSSYRNRLQWSAIGNHTGWTIGNDSSDQATLYDTPEITGIVGGEFGIVFSVDKVFQLNFVGGSTIFQIRTIEQQRGCIAPGSLVTVGNTSYFLSQDGFASTDGESTILIGENKIDDFFDGNLDQANILRITSGHDPLNKLIFWSYPSTNSSSGNPDRVLCYNYSADRWSYIVVPTQFVGSAFTTGTTLELLDNISTNIDTGFSDSFDSRIWQGGSLFFSCFNNNNFFSTFSGVNLEATIGVGEVEFVEGKRSFVSAIIPVIDVAPIAKTGTISITGTTINGTSTAFLSELNVGDVIRISDVSSQFNNAKFIISTIATNTLLSIVVAPDTDILGVTYTGYTPAQINLHSRERPGGTAISTGFTTCNDNGVATFRQSGKYHQIEMKVPSGATWENAQGMEITATVDGSQ